MFVVSAPSSVAAVVAAAFTVASVFAACFYTSTAELGVCSYCFGYKGIDEGKFGLRHNRDR